ncbi:SepM family pheromone-processing serine protease [Paenibacillus wynnii]|uniref:SepM family pheromone-processing serine protease n=1 Tax=Paenibacillus wynnii TaxID=268407 RepID=UPI0027D92B3F|nr:SepM family pheromone-processing serine protease [Paenibacillus wynnii]
MKQMRQRTGFRTTVYLFTLIVLTYVFVFMGTPYIVYQPGSASEVAPLIKVENGDAAEKGTFMMTTVSASYANVALLVASVFNSNAEVVPKETRLGEKSEEEYAAVQVFNMDSSQSYAVQAAYHAADIPYKNEPDYLFVYSVPAEGNRVQFQPGDRIISVAGNRMPDSEALTSLLAAKSIGDKVTVTLLRDGKKLTEEVQLIEVKDSKDAAGRPGLGVIIAAVQKVEAKESGKKVSFTVKDVGGPSAGLMFTMEILSQLTPGDLTKGYKVAGTGTIDPEGKVGPIGGVKHKIVAADREKAEIFFVPAGNYKEAKAKADKIGTTMKLVSVSALSDALDYMKSLPVKP